MSALGKKVLDLAEQQGLLDGKAIAELRKKVAESKFIVTPEAIAKVLVDHGHLTPFQARKVVSQAVANEPDPVEQRVAEKARPAAKPKPVEELTLAEDSPPPRRREVPTSDEIVELEAVDPAPHAGGARAADRKPPTSAELGATAEDFVELEPVDATPPTRGRRWRDDAPQPLNETIEMTPLAELSGAAQLVPIDDLFEHEAPAAPIAPAVSPRPKKAPPAAPPVDLLDELPAQAGRGPQAVLRANRPQKSVWDSPLLLIGGGLLGVIVVAFGLLFYALTSGSAAELFQQGEEEYRSGAFPSAVAVYDKFLKQYPQDANASLARVRRGMATLRQITDDGKNPRLGLETAQQVLRQIETEEKFGEARAELASILPDIADGVVTRASQAVESAKKQEWVNLAGEALALVNNPAYLPASVRKDRENQIGRIVDRLKVAERGIQQDKELAQAVEKILAAADKGQAGAGYQLRGELLKAYPGLEANAELLAAIRKVGNKERELVKVSQGGPAPFTTDHPASSEQVVLSLPDDRAAASESGPPVFMLLEGSVYGIDVTSGRVLWRRFVGYESRVQPVGVAVDGKRAAALFDGRRQELVVVDGGAGRLRWRQMLADDATGLAANGSRLMVTTRKGRVLSVDVAGGEIVCAAQLPQGAGVGPTVRQSRLFQLGEHSTLFVLNADSLACTETVYLGHKAGAVWVPPAAVLDQLMYVESPADDYSRLQVLAVDGKTKQWAPAGQARRLQGRVVTPPAVSGGRVAVTTDLGKVVVYQVEAAAAEPLRQIASAAASETTPLVTFAELDKTRLWTAGRRRTLFEVQESLAQLTLRKTENHDDRFLAPLALLGDALVTARRRSGVDAVLVEGNKASTGEALWTTQIAAPLIALVPNAARQRVESLTATGQLYALTAQSFAEGRAEKPAFAATSSSFPQAAVAADGQRIVWNRPQSGEAYVYDISTAAKAATVGLPEAAAAPAVLMAEGVVAPLMGGRVQLIPLAGGVSNIGPFMPPLAPDAMPLWTKPVALEGGKSFLISDGRGTVYAVAQKDQPQPHLATIGQSPTSGAVTALVWTGTAAIGVLRQESSDALAGFDSRGAAAFAPVLLAGRVEAGPFAVGGLALLTAEPDGLVCLTSEGKIRWKQTMSRGPLAGPPLALSDGDVLVAYQAGDVCRIDAASGKELACHEINQPLMGPTCLLGSYVYLSGSDGVVHRAPVPPRP